MRCSAVLGTTIWLTLLLSPSKASATAEICGNDIDDDGNGLTDEGCYPTLTTGVCESPLSCGDTGMVSWTTGSLHYDLPPDIAPAVPYGPGIGFRRFVTPSYSPGTGPASVNHTPLGPGWQHTYMTWIDAYTDGGSVKRIVLHTSQGRDVYYTWASNSGGFDFYTPQAGDHVLSLKYDTTNLVYYVQLLTGETLKYNSVGQIIEIWDTVSPTPNKVIVTWDATSHGNVSTVTDASGQRRLLFSYTNNLLTSMQFQILASTWGTYHTTTYDYTMGVTRDATSGWYVPATTTEWTNLLQGTGISNPTHLWGCQDTSGSLAASSGFGAVSLTAHSTGGMAYHQAVTGWSRDAVTLTDNSTSYWASASSICNPATTACTALGLISITATPTIGRDVLATGDSNGARALTTPNSPTEPVIGEIWDGTHSATAKVDVTGVHPWIVATDPTGNSSTVTVEGGTATPTWATGTSATGTLSLGGAVSHSAASGYLYAAEWSGTALTATQRATLTNRIEKGPGILTSVTIGGQLAQRYLYAAGYLHAVEDGASNHIATFSYSSTTPGQVDLITTSRGTVGFDYSSTRTGCTGDTILYFNQGNVTSCGVDSDCGSGFLCGGKTGTGTTGTCFLAGRCMATSTVNGESVITSVSPLGAGGTCTGACTDVSQYSWSSTSNLLNVTGRKDPTNNYTSATYNSNGLPTQIGYGDTDSNPANGGTNRTVYYIYDTTFPGRIAEIRRPSDLSSSASSCSSTSPTGCDRTLYGYGTDNQLHTIEQDGWTLDSAGSTTTFAKVITYTHDSNGRISEIDGAVSGIKSTFEYYTPTEDSSLIRNFLKDSKQYTDSTHFLEPQVMNYDFWGHPIWLRAPDGNYTCDTYDAARNFLTQRQRAMAGQTDCSSNASDIVTKWARDSWLRLTKATRPDSSCLMYTYNSDGTVNQSIRSDACDATGDYQQYTYTPDKQVSEVDSYISATSTIVAKQLYTYFNSRRLQEIVNPVDPSKFTGLVYDAAGKLIETDGAGSLSKTVYHFDGAPGRDDRITSEERYKTSSTSDTWSLLYAWRGDQSQVTDGDSKITASTRDDLGRLVKLASPDVANPTVRVFDAADRLTTVVEDLGGGANQQTHAFTFDALNRPLTSDYQGACATTGTSHAEIQRTYDALPAGVSCPITSCSNLAGRVAYVETILMCSSTYASTDGSLDQFTFYSYDDAGRVVEEYITDDSGRSAALLYSYTKNGALSQVTTPSTATIAWTFGSASASDTDRITGIALSSTQVIEAISWFPFGPLQGYTQENHVDIFAPTKVLTSIARNAAYRVTDISQKAGVTTLLDTAIAEDAKGRVTSRVFSGAASGVTSSYFLYDEQDRVTCETTDLQTTCPATGSDIKNNHSLSPPFLNAGDWKRVLRPVNGSTGGLINDFNTSGTAYGTSHQVADVDQSDGTPVLGHTAIAYDVRGNRSYDDNSTTLTDDRRDYTYDGRRNVVNVRGQYYTGTAWHYYDVASAFDANNRRVFKSFYDETTTKSSSWFFYYDALNRLTEVRYTPDTSVPATNSLFQLIWLGNRAVMYWQTDYPSATISKRYVGTDETGRPIDMWNWPASGSPTRVWAVNPSAWGMDKNAVGPTVYQPILFTGQYQDTETAAYENDGSTIHRPGLALNRFRTYDPFTGAYLQMDPLADQTWSSYVYAISDPVGKCDPSGRLDNDGDTTGETCDVCHDSCRLHYVRQVQTLCDPFGDQVNPDYLTEGLCYSFFSSERRDCNDDCVLNGECEGPDPDDDPFLGQLLAARPRQNTVVDHSVSSSTSSSGSTSSSTLMSGPTFCMELGIGCGKLNPEDEDDDLDTSGSMITGGDSSGGGNTAGGKGSNGLPRCTLQQIQTGKCISSK